MYRKSSHLIGLVVVLAFLLIGVGSVSAAGPLPLANQSEGHNSFVAHYLEAQAASDLTDQDKIKEAIDTYFRLRYEGQRLLETQDFALLLENPSRAWVQKEQDKREIEIYNAILNRLNYVKYKYWLNYDSLEVDPGGRQAVVVLQENHDVVFEAIAPEVSKLRNLEHTILLARHGDRWAVIQDDYRDELSEVLQYETKETIMERVRQNSISSLRQEPLLVPFEQLALAKADDRVKDHDVERIGPAPDSGGWHSYNRSAAVSYADTWANSRNPAYYDFSNYGGDCTNFASQVIYAGAPQMDNTGSWQWYYFNVNSRSPSWTNVGQLGDYLLNNTWTGPYGATTNSCGVESGDLIQLYNGSYWYHSLMVVATQQPYQCWDLSKIWINAHSTDRYHYPLSNYNPVSRRYIKINGWYD